MPSLTAAAVASLALLALCSLVIIEKPRQPPYSSSAFAVVQAPGSVAGVAPPRWAAVPSRAVLQVPPERKTDVSGARGRATWSLAAFCAVLVARATVSRIACRAKGRKHKYPNKWEQFKMPQMGYSISGKPGHPGSPHPWTEKIRWCERFKRRISIRRKVEGTCARPRLAVFRSTNHVKVNIVDDTVGLGVTMLTMTTNQSPVRDLISKEQGVERGQEKTKSVDAAEVLGKYVAEKCLENNITMVVFDRGGFAYEGRVQALAEAARSAGLQF